MAVNAGRRTVCYKRAVNHGPNRLHEIPALHNRRCVFHDRRHAGAVLADMLAEYRGSAALVLAIPAGGVPVAAEIAARLQLPLDLAVVSKLTLPWNTEAGYGALAFDGTELLNEALIARAGLDAGQIEQGRLRTRQKVAQRVQRWRGARPFPVLAGRTVILVDDSLASGFTLMVAIKALRHHGAKQIVVAVPTAPADSAARLGAWVEALYCANVRDGPSYAVADAYEAWEDVAEDAVGPLLARFAQPGND